VGSRDWSVCAFTGAMSVYCPLLSVVSCQLSVVCSPLSIDCCLLSSLRIETVVLSGWLFSGEYLSLGEVFAVQFYLSILSTILCLLCVSGDGVGFWGVSCIKAISWPDGSFVCSFLFALLFGFLSSEVLAAFV